VTSRVFNFLWLNLDLPAPPDPDDGSIREPLPAKYVENVREAGRAHPTTEIVLWVDSKRLTERQLTFLQHSIEDQLPNVHLKDLRSIPAYDQEPLYNQAETDPCWRNYGKNTLIWRQVDAAKVLVSLQGNYDEVFFADLDHAHLSITSPPVQQMLETHGLMVGSISDSELTVENQLWGFRRSRQKFFEQYYDRALRAANAGLNGWAELVTKVNGELVATQGIPIEEICLLINDDGSQAEHTGHEWRTGTGEEARPALVASGELVRIFNAKSKAPDANDRACAVAPAICEKPVAVSPVPAASYKAVCGAY
jgi:hypothetical protein